MTRGWQGVLFPLGDNIVGSNCNVLGSGWRFGCD